MDDLDLKEAYQLGFTAVEAAEILGRDRREVEQKFKLVDTTSGPDEDPKPNHVVVLAATTPRKSENREVIQIDRSSPECTEARETRIKCLHGDQEYDSDRDMIDILAALMILIVGNVALIGTIYLGHLIPANNIRGKLLVSILVIACFVFLMVFAYRGLLDSLHQDHKDAESSGSATIAVHLSQELP